jgi:hypothetical protein
MARIKMCAGPELAQMSYTANEMGDYRIRRDLGRNADLGKILKEHSTGRDERTEAIQFVMNTGKPAEDIMKKWARTDVVRK